MILALAAPIAITVLFWKHGPVVKDSYDKISLWKSLWEVRPIKEELQRTLTDKKQIDLKNMLAHQKSKPQLKLSDHIEEVKDAPGRCIHPRSGRTTHIFRRMVCRQSSIPSICTATEKLAANALLAL